MTDLVLLKIRYENYLLPMKEAGIVMDLLMKARCAEDNYDLGLHYGSRPPNLEISQTKTNVEIFKESEEKLFENYKNVMLVEKKMMDAVNKDFAITSFTEWKKRNKE
jgi:hypothetical protein